MRTIDPAKHEAKRRLILAAAADCFATKGFQDTRTADICAAAGMSSGNLFHYFPSKQAIFTAIFEQDGRDSALRLELSADADDPLAALLGFVSWMVGQSAYPHLAGLMLEVIANAKRDADFATLLERNDRATHKGLVALLRRAAHAGQIDPALDPETAANWIMVLIEGVFVRASADSGFQAVDHRGTLRRIIIRYLKAAAPTMPEPPGLDAPRSPGPSSDGALRLRGIDYDTGTNYWGGQLSRQIWNRRTVEEHMRVIRKDLRCNVICVSGTNIERLIEAATAAFGHGLQVWIQPRLFEATQAEMLLYLGEVASEAEALRQRQGELVLNIGCELTMFTQGFVAGTNFHERMASLCASVGDPISDINKALDGHLRKAVEITRARFGGPITYSPVDWEEVDWALFDIVSANHYRNADNRATYAEKLRRLRSHGKPVVVTEFGCSTFEGAEHHGGMGFDIIDFGRSPPAIKEGYRRSEETQADEIIDLLRIFREERIDGAFVYQFLSEGELHSADPRHDLDMASHAIVKCVGLDLARGIIHWQPKLSFDAVARVYDELAG